MRQKGRCSKCLSRAESHCRSKSVYGYHPRREVVCGDGGSTVSSGMRDGSLSEAVASNALEVDDAHQ